MLLMACTTQQATDPEMKGETSSSIASTGNEEAAEGPDPIAPYLQEAKFLMENDYRIAVDLQNSIRGQNHPEEKRLQDFVGQTSDAIDAVDEYLDTALTRHLTKAEVREYEDIRDAWADESEALATVFK